MPGAAAALGLLAVGATGYGLSLRLYLLAQRAFGAARTGSVFAFAPFVGAAHAVALGDRAPGWLMALGGGLMLAGVVLHLAESHGTNTSTRTWCTNMRTATTTATTTMAMATCRARCPPGRTATRTTTLRCATPTRMCRTRTPPTATERHGGRAARR